MTENELSNIIIGAAIDVHKVLGQGLLERAYRDCLCYKLEKHGLSCTREQPVPLIFEELRVDCAYKADLIVENKVIVEIKSVEAIHPNHIAQLITYLKLTKFHLGLLVNFNVPAVHQGIRRVVNNL